MGQGRGSVIRFSLLDEQPQVIDDVKKSQREIISTRDVLVTIKLAAWSSWWLLVIGSRDKSGHVKTMPLSEPHH